MSVALFANVFSHSVGCLLLFFLVSFAVQKLVHLTRPHLFIFVLFPLLWETDRKNFKHSLCQRVFCLYFPLRFFIVSVLTFRSLIYFEFIFVYGVKECSNFIFFFLHVAIQFSQHHLLNRLSSPLYSLASFVVD